ncbi:arylamine N-acetyltransferase [Chloroflexi bacterium CFX6]|nr:arylamine N-acetyltransferase [Chloroflexi bacterium CFX6]
MIDVSAYLNRINYRGATKPTIETLRGLHRAHLLAVPFENLDIHRGRRIVLDEAALFEKIVVNKRGGIPAEIDHFTLLIQLE